LFKSSSAGLIAARTLLLVAFLNAAGSSGPTAVGAVVGFGILFVAASVSGCPFMNVAAPFCPIMGRVS